MRKILITIMVLLSFVLCASCVTDFPERGEGNLTQGGNGSTPTENAGSDIGDETDGEEDAETVEEGGRPGESEGTIMYITVNGRKLSAETEDNSSAQALLNLLKDGPITVSASDYGNFEKVGSLGVTLPRNDEFFTAEPGDLILYQGSNFVLYYDVNSYTFTKIGKVTGITQSELKALLGKGDVELVLSIS